MTMRESVAAVFQSIRSDTMESYENLPKEPTSAQQVILMQKHGTPHSFALRCTKAIGEITVLEAQKAIDSYAKQWEDAA